MFFRGTTHRIKALTFAALLLAVAHEAVGYTPGTVSPTAVSGFVVNGLDRRDVLVFYNCAYTASEGYAGNMAWNGSVAGCVPGTTTADFKSDVLRRINFFRALGGLPADIFLNAAKSSKCQEAALMFSAQNAISHTPLPGWACYTADAATAAGKSNIALGNYGPGAVDAFMEDFGSGNQLVGHRRWLLYSRAQEMGTGDVPENGANNSANAIWVIDDFKPAPTPQFVAWPNRGFIPHTLIPARWSLSYPGASFTSASVMMTQGGSPVTTTIVSNGTTNVGDNTIVWEPAGLPASVTSDVTYDITVSGITGAGVPASYSYSVTLFNPDVLGDSVAISGTNTPFTTGGSYTFNSITQADQYELRVSQGSMAAWIEGGEDVTAATVLDQTTGGYLLRQPLPDASAFNPFAARTGAKALHLAFPGFVDQSFVVTRDIMPSAGSQLQWYDRGRFATTTTTLDAEVSTDNGTTWTAVFSRPGVGFTSSGLWDSNWISRSVSLAAYAGQLIQVRFIMKQNSGSISISTSGNHGFFIDDITVTNATELVNTTATPLVGAATSFTLNGTTAGAALVAGTSYYMRVRPNVGLRWYGYGAMKTVTPQAPVGYAGWVATQYPTVTGGAIADHDQDGIRSGVEYAFSLNPTAFTPGASLPQPVLAGGSLTLSYTPPVGVTGVTYGAEWSENLQDWFPVTDTGTGGQRVFSVSTAGKTSLFLRHKIAVAP